MAYTKVTRDQIASFLNTTPSELTKSWKIIGVGITDYGQTYNPQVETEKWIIHKNATSTLESFQIQGSVSQKCYFGDEVYDFVNDLRRRASVGSTVNTQVLDIDIYDEENGAYKATMYDCAVVVGSYATGETPVIEYTIYYNGDPVLGTATIVDGVPTFSPNQSL